MFIYFKIRNVCECHRVRNAGDTDDNVCLCTALPTQAAVAAHHRSGAGPKQLQLVRLSENGSVFEICHINPYFLLHPVDHVKLPQ